MTVAIILVVCVLAPILISLVGAGIGYLVAREDRIDGALMGGQIAGYGVMVVAPIIAVAFLLFV